MLSADANVPPMPQPAVRPNLLHALEVVAVLGGDVLRKGLAVLARFEILLAIEEPDGNFELPGILNDRHELFNLIGCELTGALVNIDFGLLANQIRKATADTWNLAQTKDDVAFAFHIRIENT